jgi:catalase
MATPITDDPRIEKLSNELLLALQTLAGPHPGFRPVHAKGVTCTGSFTPSPEAKTLTRAPHARRQSTPVIVRFSDAAGIPTAVDNDLAGGPRGCALRFQLGEHQHTDIVAHSTDGFPTRTPEEFLEFLRAVAASGPEATKPTPVESFLATHPSAKWFVEVPKPIPTSFARESYYAVTAFQFTNGEGVSKFGRFRIVPVAGNEYLDQAAASAKGPNFLFEELSERLWREAVRFKVQVQMANAGDPVDDATARWPKDRTLTDFGELALTARAADDDPGMRRIIFDPVPRVDGIDPSKDPLIEVRSAIYLLSGRKRRATSEQSSRPQ